MPDVSAGENGHGFEASDHSGIDADEESVVPAGCDLFSPDPDKVASLRKKGIDPRIAWVRFVRVDNGQRSRVPGEWPSEQTSTEWLLGKWGPGTYECTGLNLGYTYVARAKMTLGVQQQQHAGGFDFNAGGAGEPLEKMLMRLTLQKMFTAEPDPMRGAVADMVKMMVGMGQMQMQTAQAQIMAAQQRPTTSPETSALVEILKAQIAASGVRRDAGSTGKTPSGELLGFLQLGLQLGKQAAGVGTAAAEESKWWTMLPEIVDSVGPGLVATLAQGVLPPDKAGAVLNAIEAHMAARRAEAAATPIDAEGTSIP